MGLRFYKFGGVWGQNISGGAFEIPNGQEWGIRQNFLGALLKFLMARSGELGKNFRGRF